MKPFLNLALFLVFSSPLVAAPLAAKINPVPSIKKSAPVIKVPAKKKTGRIYSVSEIKKNRTLLAQYNRVVSRSQMTDNDLRAQLWFRYFIHRKDLVPDGKAHCPIKNNRICYIATSNSFMTVLFKDKTVSVYRATSQLPKMGLTYVIKSSKPAKGGQGSGYKSGKKSNSDTWRQGMMNALQKQREAYLSQLVDSEHFYDEDAKYELLPGEMFVDEFENVIVNTTTSTVEVEMTNGSFSSLGGSAGGFAKILNIMDLPEDIQDSIKNEMPGILEAIEVTEKIQKYLDQVKVTAEPAGSSLTPDQTNQSKGGAGDLVRILYAPVINNRSASTGRGNEQSPGTNVSSQSGGMAASSGSPEAFLEQVRAQFQTIINGGIGLVEAGGKFADALLETLANVLEGLIDFLTSSSGRGTPSAHPSDDGCTAGDACIEGSGGETGDDDEAEDTSDSDEQQQGSNSQSTTTVDDEGTPEHTAVGSGADYAGPDYSDEEPPETAVADCASDDMECSNYRGICQRNPDDPVCQNKVFVMLDGHPPSSKLRNTCQYEICEGENCACQGGSGAGQAGSISLRASPGQKIFAVNCQNVQCPPENANCCERKSSIDMAAWQRALRYRICYFMVTDSGACAGAVDPYSFCKDNPDDLRCKNRLRFNKPPRIPTPPPRSGISGSSRIPYGK